MNRYIEVDHKQLEKAAAEIEKRLAQHSTYMKHAGSEVVNMSATWEGTDYSTYLNMWEKLTYSESTYQKINDYMKYYSELLYYFSDQYKAAQAKAVNWANEIPLFY